MDNILNVLKENPWWVVGAVLIGAFLLRGSPAPAPSGRGGYDPSVTLASQEISSNTNVALAGIQVDRESVAASQNIAAIQATRDISLGAQQFAIADKQIKGQMYVEGLNQTNVLAQMTTGLTDSMFATMAGVKLAEKELSNQTLSLRMNEGLAYTDMQNNRELGLNQMSTDRYLADKGLTNANDADIRANQTAVTSMMQNLNATLANIDLQKYTLPFDERINDRNRASEENYYWRLKQIAKSQGMNGLLGSIIDGGFNLASAGMSRGF